MRNLDDLPQEEFDAAMNAAAIQGFKLFIFGMLTLGVYPIVWHYLND